MKMTQEHSKLKNHCFVFLTQKNGSKQYKKNHGFAMKIVQEPLKLKAIVFITQKTGSKNYATKTKRFCNGNDSRALEAQKTNCGYYTKMGATIILAKPNGFAMKVAQELSKLRNHCFYYTEDREQK